jgi:hypothetical protein
MQAGDDGCQYLSHTSAGDYYFSMGTSVISDRDFYITASSSRWAYYAFLFPLVSLPKNAKITGAHLELVQHTLTHTDDHNLQRVWAQRQGNSVSRVISGSDLVGRDRTYNYVDFFENTNLNGQSITPIIQELVSRNDWEEDQNNILVIIKFQYTDYNAGWFRNAYRNYSYDDSPVGSNTPKLNVTWELPEGDSGKYIISDNIQEKETYTLSGTLSNDVDIVAINNSLFMKRVTELGNDNNMSFNMLTVSSGTTYSGSLVVPAGQHYKCSNSIYELSPVTGSAWAYEDLINDEFGFTTISG